jgi:hypothetical protein
MTVAQQWNRIRIIKAEEESIFARKHMILLGVKQRPSSLSRDIWLDDSKFIKKAVSIPFRADIRKPLRIILIGGSRIGKTTLVSCILDDLQNDFNVNTLSIYPKGLDAYYHNMKGKGRFLCPGETNRTLKSKLFVPEYQIQAIPSDIKRSINRFAFELYNFDPNSEPGFMEYNPKDFSIGLYSNLSIMYHKFKETRGIGADKMLNALDKYTYQNRRGGWDSSRKIYVSVATYEALRQRLQAAISSKFFFESKLKINKDVFLNDWDAGFSHSFIFRADSNDPRVQPYTAKILEIAQKAKQKHNELRRRKGKSERPLFLVVDDAREIVASYMDFERYRARREVERCVYMFGEDGWNVLLVYHNAKDVPEGLLKEADYIISSRLDKSDAEYLPGDNFKQYVQNLFVKPYYFYNEWAVRSKDGSVRTFYAIDSRVGLK